MNDLIGTTTVISEAAMTVKKRSFGKITLFFLLVYTVGSLITSSLMTIPTYIAMFTSGDFLEFMASNPDYDAIYAYLDELMYSMPDWMIAVQLFATVGTIIAAVFYCTVIERRRFFTLGFIKKHAVWEYLLGLVIGIFLFGAVYALLIFTNQVQFVSVNLNVSIPMILIFFFGFVIQGMSEEVLLRGYYMVSVATNGNIPLAIFASSGIFALLHLGNNGINVLAVVNLFLFGVFAGVYFIKRGSIWGIGAIHTMWNFAQGNVFGCKVSGNSFGSSIISTTLKDNSIFTGGEFGPEGGLAVTIILLLGIGILILFKNKQVEPEYNFKSEFISA